MNLLEALAGVAHDRSGRVHGVVIGVVTNNQDPDGLGRVRLKFPWLSETDESAWARVASLGAGDGRGLFVLPEVDDEVLVAFEFGDPRFPYVLGGLWSGGAKPPGDKAEYRRIVTPGKNTIKLTDTAGEEKIEIVDAAGNTSIVIDTSTNSVTISAPNGKIRLEGQSIEIEATGTARLKGAMVEIN